MLLYIDLEKKKRQSFLGFFKQNLNCVSNMTEYHNNVDNIQKRFFSVKKGGRGLLMWLLYSIFVVAKLLTDENFTTNGFTYADISLIIC